MKTLDTISAISTPYGKGGVALIRISGTEALSVASVVFSLKSGKNISDISPNHTAYGKIFEITERGERREIDDGLITYFKAPHSFTGEDTIEICCHGGILITQRVLTATLAAGARHAEAGEFTRRAFLNGKLNLSEAEGLGKLLEAQNTSQLYIARTAMKGALTDKSKVLYDSLKAMLGNIYARIDFPDEDLSDISEEEMVKRLKHTLAGVEKLAKTYRTGKAIESGVKTVICGRTNAGKSSVYNCLTGDDSAIVTEIEGTTRDILKETVTIGKTTLRICDTAGFRDTDDIVENIGIKRAMDEIYSAELILAVFDSSKELGGDDLHLIATLSQLDCPTIALLNKSDISSVTINDAPIREKFKYTISVSAKENDGFDKLAELVDSIFIDETIDISTDAVVSGARQYAALVKASDALHRTLSALSAGASLDICCIDIENAMQALGELDGRAVGEDIVSEIFSKFCVGK